MKQGHEATASVKATRLLSVSAVLALSSVALPARAEGFSLPPLLLLAHANLSALYAAVPARPAAVSLRPERAARSAWTWHITDTWLGPHAQLRMGLHETHARADLLPQGRAPWLTDTGNMPGTAVAQLAGGLVNRLTLRTGQELDAWTVRVSMTQLTVKRLF
jgi:hypothetical protein